MPRSADPHDDLPQSRALRGPTILPGQRCRRAEGGRAHPGALRGSLSGPGGLALLLTLSGCAEVGHRPATEHDAVRRTFTEEVPGDAVTAKLQQDGQNVTVQASRSCNAIEKQEIDRTYKADRYNTDSGSTLMLGGGGLAGIGTGTGVLIDSGSVAPSDETSRNYNSVGPDGARILGVGLVGVGVAAAAVATVDYFRTRGTDRRTEALTISKGIRARNVQCSRPIPASGVEIAVRSGTSEAPLGKTDSDGVLKVDLDEWLPSDRIIGVQKVKVFAKDKELGRIDFAPVALLREEKAWQNTPTDSCRDPKMANACDGVRTFVRFYPRGKYAEEANALLRAAEPRLEILRDHESWSPTDAEACEDPKAKDPEAIDRACGFLEGYLSSFPNGQHSQEARAALKKGKARASSLRDQAARAERLEEERERAAVKRACVARCKMGCSSRRMNFETCFPACVEAQCQ